MIYFLIVFFFKWKCLCICTSLLHVIFYFPIIVCHFFLTATLSWGILYIMTRRASLHRSRLCHLRCCSMSLTLDVFRWARNSYGKTTSTTSVVKPLRLLVSCVATWSSLQPPLKKGIQIISQTITRVCLFCMGSLSWILWLRVYISGVSQGWWKFVTFSWLPPCHGGFYTS
jgi:hypothetical protein